MLAQGHIAVGETTSWEKQIKTHLNCTLLVGKRDIHIRGISTVCTVLCVKVTTFKGVFLMVRSQWQSRSCRVELSNPSISFFLSWWQPVCDGYVMCPRPVAKWLFQLFHQWNQDLIWGKNTPVDFHCIFDFFSFILNNNETLRSSSSLLWGGVLSILSLVEIKVKTFWQFQLLQCLLSF